MNVAVGRRCNGREPLKSLQGREEGEQCHLDISKTRQFPGIKSTRIPSLPFQTKPWPVLLSEGEPHVPHSGYIKT